MEKYRTSSHSRYDLKYHFVWISKYRKAILVGAVGIRLRELVREACRTNEIEILEGSVSRDHGGISSEDQHTAASGGRQAAHRETVGQAQLPGL